MTSKLSLAGIPMARANHKATTGRSSESNSRTSARSTDIPDPADLISQIIAAAAHAPQGRAVARLEVKFDLATQGLCSLLVELEKSVGPELLRPLTGIRVRRLSWRDERSRIDGNHNGGEFG